MQPDANSRERRTEAREESILELVTVDVVDEPIAQPLSWREITAVLLMIVLCDVTVYRSHGFAGYALLFIVAPILLLFGSPRSSRPWSTWFISSLLVLLAVRCLWFGWILHIGVGIGLLVALAMTLVGLRPYVIEAIVFGSHTVLAGYQGLRRYKKLSRVTLPVSGSSWFSVVLPMAAFLLFAMIFLFANPDLLSSFGDNLRRFAEQLREYITNYAPTPWEFVFWCVILWLTVGLLNPVMDHDLFKETAVAEAAIGKREPSPFYPAVRNMLATVIVLFGVYLAFEFKTLWFRVFPEGFHYSGYAHQGAAWLTVALAVSTVILSLVFRGGILNDPRAGRLRKLAWLWSLENFVLALAVYHRLLIYVGFNGMTRMRIVGFFGISAVVIGFCIVLWKIARNRDFVWLMRRQMWTVAFGVYLFALTPLDIVVVGYNVWRINHGDPAPSVQISVQPISPEGAVLLIPLLDCEDSEIRSGVRAFLAQRHKEAESYADRAGTHWTAWQLSRSRELRILSEHQSKWTEFREDTARGRALERFYDYGYQWY